MATSQGVKEVAPFRWVQYYPYLIEGMPFYHVMPGARVIQIGSVGCNAACDYCINSHLAIREDTLRTLKPLSPEQLVAAVHRENAQGIVFALNEVTVFLPSALAVAKAARIAGIPVGCLTNGFLTERAARRLGDSMDFINVSVKSLRDAFVRDNLHLSGAQPIRRNLRIFNERTHLEVVTPLVREIMDEDVYDILDYLCEVNSDIPWHLFRLLPTHDRAKERELSHEAMLSLWQRARERMPFTYLGNFAGSKWVDTDCPNCGKKLIRRLAVGAWNARVLENTICDGRCPDCGRAIPLVYGTNQDTASQGA